VGSLEGKETSRRPLWWPVERSFVVASFVLLAVVDVTGAGYLVWTRVLPQHSLAVEPGHAQPASVALVARALLHPLRACKVVIDPGHGGTDPGTTGRSGLHEKDVVLDIALKLAAYLQGKGVRTVLTRQSDTFMSPDDRVAVANRERPDLFISIHANSCRAHSVRGAMTFYAGADRKRSVESARLIESALRPVSGCVQDSSGVIEDQRGLDVLQETLTPSVLVEVDFLSNRISERMLASPAHRSAIANAIGGAVMEYLREQNAPG
jgi:N-acetylmuramoyl-L-alanine amidase